MRAVRASGRSWVSSSSHLRSNLDEKKGATVSDDDVAQGDGKGVELTEWHKEGWTYHAKGASFCFLFLSMCTTHHHGFLHLVPWCYRHLAFTYAIIPTHPHTLWINKPQFSVGESRYGIVFPHAHFLARIERRAGE